MCFVAGVVPVLLVHSAGDRLLTASEAAETAAFHASSLVTLESQSRAPMLTDAEAVGRVLFEWVDDLD
jgi:pimeloyl-ACP methyl ester carboxylesterase